MILSVVESCELDHDSSGSRTRGDELPHRSTRDSVSELHSHYEELVSMGSHLSRPPPRHIHPECTQPRYLEMDSPMHSVHILHVILYILDLAACWSHSKWPIPILRYLHNVLQWNRQLFKLVCLARRHPVWRLGGKIRPHIHKTGVKISLVIWLRVEKLD